MAREEQSIAVVPVWQPQVDHKLFVRILLALLDQLVAEGAAGDDVHPHGDGRDVGDSDHGDRGNDRGGAHGA